MTVKNNLAEDLDGIVVYLDGEMLEALDTMKPGETKVVSYIHEVTEDEIGSGGFRTEASAVLVAENMRIPLNLMEEFSKPVLEVSTRTPDNTSDEDTSGTESEPDSEPDTEPESKPSGKDSNPGTGATVGLGMAVLAAAAVIIVMNRRKSR